MKYLKLFEELKIKTDEIKLRLKRKFIEDFYTHRCTDDYNDPDSVGWIDENSQENRFGAFLGHIKSGDSVLDYGCGVGDFSKYIKSRRKNIKYFGVDIQPKMISNAKEKFPDEEFKVIDKIEDVKDNFDWIVASGVFTVNADHQDVSKYFELGYEKCSKGIIANFLISEEDRISSHEYQKTKKRTLKYTHYNPNLLRKYLEDELGHKLRLITDYSDEDFTLILRK